MGTTLHSKRVVLVTEFCIPLEIAIQKQEKEEIYAGLYNILKAVIFLNEKVKFIFVSYYVWPCCVIICEISVEC